MTTITETNSFLTELNDCYFKKEEEICPINSCPFDDNAITLPCTHKFNYIPLFKYIYSIKKKSNRYNTVKLHINELQCPMCRIVSKQLLPFIPHENIKTRILGITSPSKYCISHKTCSKHLRSGKNKGKLCGKPGYHTIHGDLCEKHHRLVRKPPPTNISTQPLDDNIWKIHTIKTLKALLKQNKLMVSGNKSILIDRLLDNNIVINV